MQLPLDAVRGSDVTEMMRNNMEVIDGISYIQVHPTFLYESLWNVGILVLMLWRSKHKTFDGEILLTYLFGYGIGRFLIEGLRTDQLLIPGTSVAVSQVLAILMAITSAVLIYIYKKKQLIQQENIE